MNISNSKAKTYEHCKKQFHYKYVQKLEAKVKDLPLAFGSWIHELIEVDSIGEDWLKRHRQLKKQYNKYFPEEKDMLRVDGHELPEACFKVMRAYIYNYRDVREEHEIIATELDLEKYQIKMPHGHIMTGRIDRLSVNEYGLWIWETKTHDRFPDAMTRFTDIQSARYAWAIGQLPEFKQYGPVVGIMWDYILRKIPKKPKLTTKGVLSKAKVNTDLFTFISALKEYGLDPRDYRDDIMRLREYNKFFLRVPVPVTDRIVKTLTRDLIYIADDIERGKWKPVRNIGKHCKWCFARKLCTTELYGGDTIEVLEKNFTKKGGEDGNKNEEAA